MAFQKDSHLKENQPGITIWKRIAYWKIISRLNGYGRNKLEFKGVKIRKWKVDQLNSNWVTR